MKFEVVCFHCGYINRFEIPLVGKGNEALHRCEECNFFIVNVYPDDDDS